jgi:hypothetical protein
MGATLIGESLIYALIAGALVWGAVMTIGRTLEAYRQYQRRSRW